MVSVSDILKDQGKPKGLLLDSMQPSRLVVTTIPYDISIEPLKTAKSWSGCLVVSNKSFSFATE